jgi:hypothetical protein
MKAFATIAVLVQAAAFVTATPQVKDSEQHVEARQDSDFVARCLELNCPPPLRCAYMNPGSDDPTLYCISLVPVPFDT